MLSQTRLIDAVRQYTMPVYSMTGYASIQLSSPNPADPSGQISLELRSVNSRFLDIVMRLPDELRAQEPSLREGLSKRIRRGKIEVRVMSTNALDGALAAPDVLRLQQLAVWQSLVQQQLPSAAPLSTAEAMRLAATGGNTQWSDAAGQIGALMEEGIAQLQAARAREGEHLARSLIERIASLRQLAAQAAPLIPQVVEQQRQRFLSKWDEALSSTQSSITAQQAQERALTEATAFAIRIDVAEELTRLQAHLDEIERLIGRGGEMGKRLDFMIQELHREANTLGSKSTALEMTQISVDMKVLIEQMREQVQNIE
jgi:uncharacterized protein (TIGR00255 family)